MNRLEIRSAFRSENNIPEDISIVDICQQIHEHDTGSSDLLRPEQTESYRGFIQVVLDTWEWDDEKPWDEGDGGYYDTHVISLCEYIVKKEK